MTSKAKIVRVEDETCELCGKEHVPVASFPIRVSMRMPMIMLDWKAYICINCVSKAHLLFYNCHGRQLPQ